MKVLDAVIATCAAVALAILWTGGGRVEVGGLAISVRSWARPALFAFVLFGVFRVPFLAYERSRVAGIVIHGATLSVAALAMAAVLVTATGVIHACGGLDSHGYVGASALFSEFRLKRTLPDLSWLPLDRPAEVAAPLGFVASSDGRYAVPEFPPGLPLVMAVVRSLFGPEAVFWVSWVSGAAASVVVFLLARRIYGILTAQLAAIFLLAHPVFAAYSMQPMSDVPATLWTVLSVYLVVGTARPRPASAGLAGSLALLTRPPLGLALLVLAGALARMKRRHAIVFVCFLAPGALGLMLLQQQLYGSPFVSGHGDAGHLFTANAFLHNLIAQGKWFLLVQTPLVVPLVWLGYRSDERFGRLSLALFAAVSAPYLFYVVQFDDWEMLRFLLPGLALLMPLAAEGTATLVRRSRSRTLQQALLVTLVLLALASSGRFLEARGMFRLPLAESKYPLVGTWLSGNTRKDAVVLAALHSGSIYYYTGHLTLRWDRLPPDRLEATIIATRGRGFPAYLVLDGPDEVREFNRRFGLGSDSGIKIEQVGRIRDVDIAEIQLSTDVR